jgi:hypothetical protein
MARSVIASDINAYNATTSGAMEEVGRVKTGVNIMMIGCIIAVAYRKLPLMLG